MEKQIPNQRPFLMQTSCLCHLFILPALSALLFLTTLTSHAEIIGVEQFDYPDGAINGKNGGTFWDFGNIAPPVHDGSPSLWNNVVRAPVVSGGRLVTDDNSALRPHNGPSSGFGMDSDEERGSVTDGRLQQVVYHRVTFTTGSTVPAFLGLSTYDFGTERIFFGKRANQSVFGIETFNGFGVQNSTIPVAANTTYLLVSKVDYGNNRLSLFINPTLGGSEPSSPAAVIENYTINNFSTSVRLGSATGGAVTWDDLVVATSWEELGTVVTTTVDENNGSLNPGHGNGISLREAVTWSPAGSLITFAKALNGQTCTLSLGELVVADRNLTIDASSLANGFTVDGNDASRIFRLANKALTLKSLTLTRSRAGEGGGAIQQFGGQLFVQNCTLSENSAVSGGAVAQVNETTSRFENCTIVGNRATVVNSTGGLLISFGTCTLVNCTTSGNTGTGQGGGLSLQSNAIVSLSNCIIAGNSDSFANDISRGGSSGTLTASGNNLIGSNATVSGIFSGPLVGTQATPLDPKLSPLGYFGGPTMTMHPLIGSPAIDAGGSTNPGGTDQRGFPRFVDGDGNAGTPAQLDIGAVEAGPLRNVAFSSDNVGSNGSLRARIDVSTEPGARIGFLAGVNFPGTTTLNGTELTIPATANGLFIDASNLSGPVTVSGGNASRVFNIPAGATVAMHSLAILNGRAPDGASAQAGASGGGILNAGSLSLFSCSVKNNRSGNGGNVGIDGNGGGGGGGGGIFSTGSLSLNACTLSGNATGIGGNGTAIGGDGGGGGGIFSTGSLSLTACTLFGNATGNGGNGSGDFGGFGGDGAGIRKSDDTPYRLTACTVVGNRTGTGGTGPNFNGSAGYGGGVSSGSLILQNSIVANNTGFGTARDVNVASLTYLGANLLSTSASSFSTTGLPTFINANPLLAPLGNYGGPTQTMRPLPGSPAIDTASGSTRLTDQRGFPIVGLPDLGAGEYQGTTDLRLYWLTDADGDGIPFGIEHALGTYPTVSDRSSTRNLTRPTFNAQGQASIQFGRNPSASSGTISILKRSTDLITFTEIFRNNGNSTTNGSGISSTVNPNDITVIDPNPPKPKAFYRVEAVAP